MADEKNKNSVKYKYGESELDLDRYIKNLDHNVQGYMDSQNWNEGQRQEFMNAYKQFFNGFKEQRDNNNNRFYTDSFGTIMDTQGILSDVDSPDGTDYYYDSKGNQISNTDYDALKARKQKNYSTFSANQQVSKYFGLVGKSLLKKMQEETPEPEPSSEFDMNKHGFVKYWENKYGGFDGDSVLNLDALNDGVRSRTNRTERLKQELNQYKNQLGDYDFSNSLYKTREGYLNAMSEVIKTLDNGLDTDDSLDLSRLGISSSFLQPFLSTDSVVSKTPEQIAAE